MDGLQAAMMRARIRDFAPTNGHAVQELGKTEPVSVGKQDKVDFETLEARVRALEIAVLAQKPDDTRNSQVEIKPRIPSLQEVKQVVCLEYGLSDVEITSECRQRRITWARQIAMYLCRKLTPRSFPQIARHFGIKDHSTAVHAHQKIGNTRKRDPDVDKELAELECRLTSQIT